MDNEQIIKAAASINGKKGVEALRSKFKDKALSKEMTRRVNVRWKKKKRLDND